MGWALAQVQYDRPDSVLTGLQKQLMIYVVLKRQRLDILKTIALCHASLATASRENKELVRSAEKSLKRYIEAAEFIKKEEESSQEKLTKILANTQPVFYVKPQ